MTSRLNHNRKHTAEALDVSVRTVDRLVQDDPTFPRPIQIRGRRYWSDASLRAYLDRKRHVLQKAAAK